MSFLVVVSRADIFVGKKKNKKQIERVSGEIAKFRIIGKIYIFTLTC